MADVTLRLFASAREAAGTGSVAMAGPTVGSVLDAAVEAYGASFGDLLVACNVWRNGEPAERDDALVDGDEVAVLPPVSGG